MGLRAILLPPEHGGWSFLFEPIVLALLVAPSWRGASVALAVTLAFLARQPLRRLLSDVRRRRSSPATGVALLVAAIELLLAAIFLVASLHGSLAHLVPLLLALPVAVAQVVFDARNESRSAAAELLAPLGLGAAAPAIAIAGGWGIAGALVLWLLVGARAIPTVLYVRSRLRETQSGWLPVVAHLAALIVVAMLFRRGYAPMLAVVALLLLLTRAAIGVFGAKPATAKRIGIGEIVHGAATIALIAVGFHFTL